MHKQGGLTLQFLGESGKQYGFAHLSKILVEQIGRKVRAGQSIALTGGKPGSYGSGNSRGSRSLGSGQSAQLSG